MTAWTTLTIAVVAPIPTAMVRTSTAAKPGSRAKLRSATRISRNIMLACSGDFLEESVAQQRRWRIGTRIFGGALEIEALEIDLLEIEIIELQVIDVHIRVHIV